MYHVCNCKCKEGEVEVISSNCPIHSPLPMGINTSNIIDLTKDELPITQLPNGQAFVNTDEWKWKYPLFTMEGFIADPTRKADHVLYWSFDVASIWLKENNIKYRVTSIDGRPLIITCDYQVERANFKLVNNKIEEVTYG